MGKLKLGHWMTDFNEILIEFFRCWRHCERGRIVERVCGWVDKTSLSIFNFPDYEETCLNRVVVCVISERPLRGGGWLLRLCREARLRGACRLGWGLGP